MSRLWPRFLVRVGAALLVAVSVAVLAAGCGGGAAEPKTIKIGVAAPITTTLGEDFANGAKLAAKQANDKGGVLGKKVEIVAMDDQADPKQATNVAQRLVDAGVVGVVGHFTSGTTIPTTSIYAKARIPQVTPASNPQVTAQGFDNVFRLNPDDTVQGRAMGDYAVKVLGLKSFAIIHDKQAFGQGVAEQFQAAVQASGGTITSFNGITPGDVDFKSVLTKIKGENPDAVYFGGTYQEGGLIVNQMRALGMTQLFLAPDSCYGSDFVKTATPQYAEGAIISFPAPPLDSSPELRQFVQEYKAEFGKDTILGEYGYDGALIIIQAIQKCGSADPDAVRKTIHSETFKGTLHNYKFDDKGNLVQEKFPIYQVKDGQFQFLGLF
ncbi:MAG: branched-chain amino acid ABC transporter substrate-binding protein [Bacillota bacterium]|nr:branched-chain amino acid ABC transporter substrate-binding protein [Bacillota bacterium]MDI7249744.1 branched-chain amino acid ABC transporter substrate-binding protein [Bacillota bacterium]